MRSGRSDGAEIAEGSAAIRASSSETRSGVAPPRTSSSVKPYILARCSRPVPGHTWFSGSDRTLPVGRNPAGRGSSFRATYAWTGIHSPFGPDPLPHRSRSRMRAVSPGLASVQAVHRMSMRSVRNTSKLMRSLAREGPGCVRPGCGRSTCWWSRWWRDAGVRRPRTGCRRRVGR